MAATIGIEILSWCEEELLQECLRRLLKVFEAKDILGVIGECYVHLNEKPVDHTRDIFESFRIPTIWCGTMIERDRRNYAKDILNRDWTVIVDSDEFWEEHDLHILKAALETLPEDFLEVRADMVTYWKDRNYKIDPAEPSKLLAAVRRSKEFVGTRGTDLAQAVLIDGLKVHHLSYVGPDDRIRRKIATFAPREPIPDGWYENVWERWTPEMEDLHPIYPPAYKRAVPCEPPPE